MTGAEIKGMVLSAGVRLWKVADKLGMSDSYFSRRLRKDFSAAEVEQISQIIQQLQIEEANKTA